MGSDEEKRIDILGGRPVVTIHLWIDRLISQLGNPGRYQICLFILLLVNYMPVAFNHLAMSVYGWKFTHVCDPYNGNYSSFQNVTLGKCGAVLYDNSGNNQSVVCETGQWRFIKDEGEDSIVTEYGLVCDKDNLVNLATTIYFLGVLAGGTPFGYVADRFGRKPTFIVCLFTPVALGIGVRFASSYLLFVVLRFFIGFLMQGLMTATITSYMEIFQSNYRACAGATSELMWTFGEVVLACIAYVFRSWKDIQLAICLPSLLVLTYIAFVPESFRWLLLKGRTKRAERIARTMTRLNKLQFPEETWRNVKSVSEQLEDDDSSRKYSLFDLVRTPEIRKRTLIICYFWLAAAIGYYGLIIQISSLSGDRHLNVLFGSLAGVVGAASCFLSLRFLGRKKCLMMYNLIAGAACIISGALPNNKDADFDYDLLKTAFALIGKCAMTGTFTIIVLYNQEIFPTVIRSIAFGTGATAGRLGGVIAPQINTLGKYTSRSFPIIFFGSLSLLTSLLVLMCPETRFKKLPDTIEDVENARKKKALDMNSYGNETELPENYMLFNETHN